MSLINKGLIEKQLENYKNKMNFDELKEIIQNIDISTNDYNNYIKWVSNHIYYSKKKKTYHLNLKKTRKSGADNYYKKLTKNNNNQEKSSSNHEMKFGGQNYIIKNHNEIEYGPYGTDWVHDEQKDDILNKDELRRVEIYEKLRAVELPEQRSKEWFEMREGAITASDGGAVLNKNFHSPPYEFIMKKLGHKPFSTNAPCYHGKKMEEIATMIYAYRMNVQVEEFGLMIHPDMKFIGASPDGIVSTKKLDNKHKTKFVGRMLEIKCPVRRKKWITSNVEISNNKSEKNVICPYYYWIQMQLQLECCDLDECDFWQCDITEYDSRDDFINDTDPNEPFRSLKTGYEKGCLIQIIKKEHLKEYISDYDMTIYDKAEFLYPPKIEMDINDIDTWLGKTIPNIEEDYILDKVIYWRLNFSKNVTFKRDKEWFENNLPEMKKMWNRVEFFRENEIQRDLYVDYVKNIKTNNKNYIELADKLIDINDDNYVEFLKNTKKKILKAIDRNEKMEIYEENTEKQEQDEIKEMKKLTDRFKNFSFDD